MEIQSKMSWTLKRNYRHASMCSQTSKVFSDFKKWPRNLSKITSSEKSSKSQRSFLSKFVKKSASNHVSNRIFKCIAIKKRNNWKSTKFQKHWEKLRLCEAESFRLGSDDLRVWEGGNPRASLEECFAPTLSRLLVEWECPKFGKLQDFFSFLADQSQWCDSPWQICWGELRWDLGDFSEDVISDKFRGHILKSEKTFNVCEDIEVFL